MTTLAEHVEYLNILTRFEHSQNEKLMHISEHCDPSIHRHTDAVTGIVQASTSNSRKHKQSDHWFDGDKYSVGPHTKVTRA